MAFGPGIGRFKTAPCQPPPMTAADDDAYSGVLGAIPYAIRASDSWTFRGYAALGTLVVAFVAVLFAFAIVGVFAATTGGRGGTFSFSRAFFVFVALLVVAPLLAPILSVARKHRRGAGEASYDLRMGGLGLALLASLYVGLVATVPPEQQESYGGVGEPVVVPLVEFLYGLPRVAGLAFPAVVSVAILLYHRRRGRVS
jgi:hypothetical protein